MLKTGAWRRRGQIAAYIGGERGPCGGRQVCHGLPNRPLCLRQSKRRPRVSLRCLTKAMRHQLFECKARRDFGAYLRCVLSPGIPVRLSPPGPAWRFTGGHTACRGDDAIKGCVVGVQQGLPAVTFDVGSPVQRARLVAQGTHHAKNAMHATIHVMRMCMCRSRQDPPDTSPPSMIEIRLQATPTPAER